jgi:hypothetical protein
VRCLAASDTLAKKGVQNEAMAALFPREIGSAVAGL